VDLAWFLYKTGVFYFRPIPRILASTHLDGSDRDLPEVEDPQLLVYCNTLRELLPLKIFSPLPQRDAGKPYEVSQGGREMAQHWRMNAWCCRLGGFHSDRALPSTFGRRLIQSSKFGSKTRKVHAARGAAHQGQINCRMLERFCVALSEELSIVPNGGVKYRIL
jgi:hypothetical protein